MPLIGTKNANLYIPSTFKKIRHRAPGPKNLNLIYISLNQPSVTIFTNCVYTL